DTHAPGRCGMRHKERPIPGAPRRRYSALLGLWMIAAVAMFLPGAQGDRTAYAADMPFGYSNVLPDSGRYTWSVAVGDLNGDGTLDRAIGNQYADMSRVYLGNGKGGFGFPADLPGSGHLTTSVAVGDLNGDGALDLVIGNAGTASQVYLGDGKGGFGLPAD